MTHKNIPEKELRSRLQQINDDIERFIKNSIELREEIKTWRNLAGNFKPIRCWDIKGCKRENCPAYGSDDYRCWLCAGTLCGGEVQGEFAKKLGACFKCDVFQMISELTL